MWVAKLRLRHEDCVIGSRCKRFNVTSIGVPFNTYTSGNFQYFSHFETLQGKDEDIKTNYWDHAGWKWVDSEKLIDEAHEIRRPAAKIYLDKFKQVLTIK